jgi:uncharacterized membrane protein
MITLTVWQLLALVGAGALLTLCGLGWLVAALASRYQDSALGFISQTVGCVGRTAALLSAAAALGLIWVALTK